jgi:hypothetical protein
MTISTFNRLVTYLSADNCPILNLFLDWNPVYEDTFIAGDSNTEAEENVIYVPPEGEPNHWAKL